MTIVIYVISLLLAALLVVFVTLFFVFVLDSILRGHDLPTSKQAIKALIKIIDRNKPSANNFYDLGCGRGTLLLAVKRKYPHLFVYGVDNNAIRIFFAKLKAALFKQKINFKKQDLFQIDLRNADIIYTYLWYDLMPPLEEKLQKELKRGAIVITNTSKFPNWKPQEKYITYSKISTMPDFETLFVYVKE